VAMGGKLADRVGFEPTEGINLRRFSRQSMRPYKSTTYWTFSPKMLIRETFYFYQSLLTTIYFYFDC